MGFFAPKRFHSNLLSYQTYPRSILHRISPFKVGITLWKRVGFQKETVTVHITQSTWLLCVCVCVCVSVQDAGALTSVFLRPLEGMEALDMMVSPGRVPHDTVALGPLLKLCSGWQRPGAAVQGQCVLVSPARFEVDVGYHADVIAAFKQTPSRCYGGTAFIGPYLSSPCMVG